MIDKLIIDEIARKTDIVDIVGRYLDVQKKGKLYVALCPFHNDTHPSLQLNPERNTFHCWVDGHCGNAFSFIMQYEHVNFIEAVKKVAEIIGFDHQQLHQQQYIKKIDDDTAQLLACINDLNLFYEYTLFSEAGKEIQPFLKKRCITQEIAKKFHIGYALKNGIQTIKFLRSKNYSIKTIEDIGITKNIGDDTFDYNQGRLIFAITNHDGHVVGFSSRKIDDDNNGPKYINSPETKIFSKGTILYNFYNANTSARNKGFIYLLEGFMDVIALHKIDISNAVALMGTSLSKKHIDIFRKMKVEVRLCLDGDDAGQTASLRIIQLLLKHNIPVTVIDSFKNKFCDVDEILNHDGPEALKKYLNNFLSPFDFILNYYQKENRLENAFQKEKLLRFFISFLISIDPIKSKLTLDNYIYKISDITDFTYDNIKNIVEEVRKKNSNRKDDMINNEEINNVIDYNVENFHSFFSNKDDQKRINESEQEMLHQMLSYTEAIVFFKEKIEYFNNPIYQKIALYLLNYYNGNVENSIKTNDIITFFEMDEEENQDNKKEIIKEIVKFANKRKEKYDSEHLDFLKKKIDYARRIMLNRYEFNNRKSNSK